MFDINFCKQGIFRKAIDALHHDLMQNLLPNSHNDIDGTRHVLNFCGIARHLRCPHRAAPLLRENSKRHIVGQMRMHVAVPVARSSLTW